VSLKKYSPILLIIFFFALLFAVFSWYYQSGFVYGEYLRICTANYRTYTTQYTDCMAVFNTQADFYRNILVGSLVVLVISGLGIIVGKYFRSK
jgi:hypothetical protein